MTESRSRSVVSRRRFLAAAGAGVTLLAADGLLVEPRRLTVTRHVVRSPGAQPGGRRVRIVQLTDLHLHSVGSFHEEIAHAVQRADPHLIVIVGDTVDRDDGLTLLGDFMSLLDPAIPKFATWGNWEHYTALPLDEIAGVYARHGCRVLDNASAVLRVNGTRLLVTGLDSAQDGKPDLAKALRDVEPAPNHLVLAHCPIQRDDVVARTVGARGRAEGTAVPAVPDVWPPAPLPHSPSLVLSGHTHGGQITLGGWAPITPVGSGRYVAGWYTDAPIPLYVSRGLGTT
ncbi:MAG TPA: metallophosphoesterase, partial [Gemmatimonadaceae bacterium]|nr:metallophosphoesterase [Gemmatimonadaceae bacterium]